MTLWPKCIECQIPRATDTHSEYVKRIAFPLQQWLHDRTSTLRYTYIASLVSSCCTKLSFYVTTCFGHTSWSDTIKKTQAVYRLQKRCLCLCNTVATGRVAETCSRVENGCVQKMKCNLCVCVSSTRVTFCKLINAWNIDCMN